MADGPYDVKGCDARGDGAALRLRVDENLVPYGSGGPGHLEGVGYVASLGYPAASASLPAWAQGRSLVLSSATWPRSAGRRHMRPATRARSAPPASYGHPLRAPSLSGLSAARGVSRRCHRRGGRQDQGRARAGPRVPKHRQPQGPRDARAFGPEAHTAGE